jgi:hypothetical protein
MSGILFSFITPSLYFESRKYIENKRSRFIFPVAINLDYSRAEVAAKARQLPMKL